MLELNLSGLNCPIPVLQTKKFLSNVESGISVRILTTDPASIVDLQEFCHKTGHILINQEQVADKIYTIVKRR
jgi:tRNA 2-thiouridine synthesizing protein A